VLLTAGAVAAAISAVLGLIWMMLRAFTKIAAPHFGQAVRDAIGDELRTIHAELRLNGGASLKDVVNATREDVRTLSKSYEEGRKRAEKFEAYTHDRNHDILNRLAVVSTRIDLYHGPLRPHEEEQ
jgi:hypothetical protein